MASHGPGRSSRLTAEDGALLVVDLQQKLLEVMGRSGELAVANSVRLVQGARLLGVPVRATEQYPKGLGATTAELAATLPERPSKMVFHAAVPAIRDWLADGGKRHVTLCGIEAHICVAQTALELMDQGYVVQVAADAVASRNRRDARIALRRLQQAGAVVSTTEAVLFEWLETAEHPQFKAISKMVREFQPPRSERKRSRSDPPESG